MSKASVLDEWIASVERVEKSYDLVHDGDCTVFDRVPYVCSCGAAEAREALGRTLASMREAREGSVVGYLAGEVAPAGAPDDVWESRHFTSEQFDEDDEVWLLIPTEASDE